MTEYPGNELELFAAATNWKRYFAARIKPYIGQRVLEVGSGLGETTRALMTDVVSRWVCVEPDPKMAARLERQAADGSLPPVCNIVRGTIDQLAPARCFDTIVYIDVLEHIEDDRREVERASERLADGGYLVVLAPAHQMLYSPFDAAIGHFRRYNRQMLRELTPTGLQVSRICYLDAVGLCASLANRWLLRQSLPTGRQIHVWDKMIVPLAALVDPLTFYRLGKSALAIWQRPMPLTRSAARR